MIVLQQTETNPWNEILNGLGQGLSGFAGTYLQNKALEGAPGVSTASAPFSGISALDGAPGVLGASAAPVSANGIFKRAGTFRDAPVGGQAQRSPYTFDFLFNRR